MDQSMERPCPELPVDVLVLIFARVFCPTDCARFQAVSRSWRSAARPLPPQLPLIMHPAGGFLNPSDRVLRRLVSFHETTSCSTDSDRYHGSPFSFHDNTRCIGSTNGWIAVDCRHADNRQRHTYLLHNDFSGTTLAFPELDAAFGHASKLFEIRKVLLRSTPDDVIAIMTNHPSCPIILARRGKGAWFPKQHADPLIDFVDVAFLGDRLYGITIYEGLGYLDIASDDYGVPMVTGSKCVIGEDFDAWSDEEDDYDDDDDEDDHNDDDDDVVAAPNDDNNHKNYDKEDDTSDCDDEYKNDDIDDAPRDLDADDETSDCEDKYENVDDVVDDDDDDEYKYDLTKMTEDDTTHGAIRRMDVDEYLHEIKPIIFTKWYLIESRGKMLMVRRQVLQSADPYEDREFTHKVEVFEADMSSTKWVPVEGGLGGQALFISRPFCKSVTASCSKEIQDDVLYFIDTDDVFDMRSKTISSPRVIQDYGGTLKNCNTDELTWVFPPELLG